MSSMTPVFLTLTTNGHNEVDASSRGCSRLLALSARRRHIIDPGHFLTGGPPSVRIGDRVTVPLQYWSILTMLLPLQRTRQEAGFQGEGGGGELYDDNMIDQQSSLDVGSDLNEWSHSWAMSKPSKTTKKITINKGDGATRPLCWDKNKLSVKG